MPLSKWRRFINFTLESVNVDDTKQDQNHFWNTRWNGNKRKFPDDIRGKWLLRTTKQPRSHATLSPSFARGGRENIAHYKYHRLHVWTKMRVLIRETKAIETWIYGYAVKVFLFDNHLSKCRPIFWDFWLPILKATNEKIRTRFNGIFILSRNYRHLLRDN